MKALIKIGFIAITLLVMSTAISICYAQSDRMNDGEMKARPDVDFKAGWIEWFEEDKIVINDTQFIIADNTRLFDHNEQDISAGYLKIGMYVAYLASTDFNLIFIKEKILGEDMGDAISEHDRFVPEGDQEGDGQEGDDEQEESSGELDKKGGVWKN